MMATLCRNQTNLTKPEVSQGQPLRQNHKHQHHDLQNPKINIVMSNTLDPKKGDRIEKPIEPDLKKGNSASEAQPKPLKPPPPSKPKN
jgi:hypothetical protein